MDKTHYMQALADYKEARQKAALQALLARLTGKSEQLELLSYEEVRQKLRGIKTSREHLRTIPLNAIVGSVGRYNDFTRNFLPRESVNKDRWARIRAEALGLTGLPPIDVYKIGEVYFVLDGNHRVSVARQMKNETIEAYVTEIKTKVPLTADSTPDDLIIKAEYTQFLEETKLEELHPDADLITTRAGAYPILLEHIEVHRYFMGLERNEKIPYREAVNHWYEKVYAPVIKIIQERGILRSFPDRTETDLYLWLANHQAGLKKKLGWEVDTESAIMDLEAQNAHLTEQFSKRVMTKFLNIITPEALVDDGSATGEWRKEQGEEAMKGEKQLFDDILVAIDESENAWNALDQALIIAGYEQSAVHGLHVFPDEQDQEKETALALGTKFTEYSQAAGNEKSQLSIAIGKANKKILEHSRFTDLVVLPLNHPPGEKPIERIASGIRNIIQRCHHPLLTVPNIVTPLKRAVLAYDGSPKSREALYVSAYIANRWGTSLTVLTGSHGVDSRKDILNEAKEYLEGKLNIQATYVETESSIVDEIKKWEENGEIDLILIGGYSATPMMGLILGSTVDKILRKIWLPVLICR